MLECNFTTFAGCDFTKVPHAVHYRGLTFRVQFGEGLYYSQQKCFDTPKCPEITKSEANTGVDHPFFHLFCSQPRVFLRTFVLFGSSFVLWEFYRNPRIQGKYFAFQGKDGCDWAQPIIWTRVMCLFMKGLCYNYKRSKRDLDASHLNLLKLTWLSGN